jgi:uncharacterized protein YlxW (UPF0749 family)
MMTPFETFVMWVVAPLVSALAGGFGGWFFGRKKQRIDTFEAANATRDKVIASLQADIAMLLVKNTEANEQIGKLTEQVKTLTTEVEKLKEDKKENVKLKKQVQHYEKLLTDNNIDF